MKNTTLLAGSALILLSLSGCAGIKRNTTTAPAAAEIYAAKGSEQLEPVAERAPSSWGSRFSPR